MSEKKARWQQALSCLKERRLPWRVKDYFQNSRMTPLINILKYGTPDIFVQVYFDTITACNRRCYYCPNSKFDRGLMKNMKKMDTKLFHKIINELAEQKWKGSICPNFYGEPLLDDRLPDLVGYARSRLPDSMIRIYTNGDFLSVDLYKELVKQGVTCFVVTQHPGNEHTLIQEVLAYRKQCGNDNVWMKHSKIDRIIRRRGLDFGKTIDAGICEESALQKVGINWNGDVIFCCNDYFVKVKFGNVKNERLMDIWKKPYYQQVRKALRKGVFMLEACKECVQGQK